MIIKLDVEHVVNNADWLDERGMLSKLALLGRRVSMNKVMHRFKDRLQPDSLRSAPAGPRECTRCYRVSTQCI